MKRLLKRKTPVDRDSRFPEGRLQAKMETAKRRLAGWLHRQSEKLSISTKKTLLIVCCLVFGSLMLLRVFNGLGIHPLPDIGTITKPITPLPGQKMNIDTAAADSTRE